MTRRGLQHIYLQTRVQCLCAPTSVDILPRFRSRVLQRALPRPADPPNSPFLRSQFHNSVRLRIDNSALTVLHGMEGQQTIRVHAFWGRYALASLKGCGRAIRGGPEAQKRLGRGTSMKHPFLVMHTSQPTTNRPAMGRQRRVTVIAVASALAATLAMASSRPAAACIADSECDDGLACTGIETCNLLSGLCEAGTPVDCSACSVGFCEEPSGTCGTGQKVDGFGCDDNDRCTLNDECQGGACVPGAGADTDHDGYCDDEEASPGCSAVDPAEIPPQANAYSGGGKPFSAGEILMTFNVPRFFNTPHTRRVFVATDPSCATAGVCNTTTKFCTSGKMDDPCTANSECNQPPGTCRIVINYADASNLTLVSGVLKRHNEAATDVRSIFLPATPGCSRKVDLSFPSGFKRARVRLKATGTLGGKLRRDRDKIVYKP